ncbi:hypothetical protein TNCV_4153981 [Trichonephila clavipes]|nr:hypothetical protein TNCV_4153981 [Trichonephila clavipes]
MAASSSSVITTLLADTDNQGEGHQWGAPLQVLFWHGDSLNRRRAACMSSREVGGRGREVWNPDHTSRMFSLKIGVEPIQNVLYPNGAQRCASSPLQR